MTGVIESATQKASLELRQFLRKLKVNQAALVADLDHLSHQVSAFAQLTDINEQTEYAGQGAHLMAQLTGAAERAARINVEEHLLDQPKSESPRIAQLQKELQPYLDLWVCPCYRS
jgi:hypothetical protein